MRVWTSVPLALAALGVAIAALGVRAGLAARDADDHSERASIARAGRLGLEGFGALQAEQDALRGAQLALQTELTQLAAEAAARGQETSALSSVRVERHALTRDDQSRWTVSATAGAAWIEAARTIRDAPRTWRDASSVWAVADASGPTRHLARATLVPDPHRALDLGAAMSGLLALTAADPEPAPPTVTRPDALALAVAVLLVAILGVAAYRRFDRPVTAALAAAGRWREGLTPPPTMSGNRGARAIIAALTAAQLECDRRLARATADITTDALRLAEAVSAVGQGDLAPHAPLVVTAPLDPIARAHGAARTALAARIVALHDAAVATARAAQHTLDAHARSSRNGRAIAAHLDTLDAHTAATRASVSSRRDDTFEALTTLGVAAEHLRRATREFHARVAGLARRAGELSGAAERLRVRAAGAQDADESLDLLASIAAVVDPIPIAPGQSIPAAHALATARRGRAGLAELRGEADALTADLAAAAHELARTAGENAAAVHDAPPAAVALAREAIGSHLGSAERLAELLAELGHALAQLDTARGHGEEELATLAAQATPLRHALSAWDLGPAVDRTWLSEPPTPPSEPVALGALREAARASQARLDELLRLVEAEADLTAEAP